MRNWLREARSEKGFTMAVLAEKLDITESYYSLIERGERQRNMDLTLVSKLSAALDISVSQIIEFEKAYTASLE